jgi:hypothetical protein
MIPQSTLNELVQLCVVRSEAAAQFKEAIKAQAALYEVHPTALRRYVSALAVDEIEELEREINATRELISSRRKGAFKTPIRYFSARRSWCATTCTIARTSRRRISRRSGQPMRRSSSLPHTFPRRAFPPCIGGCRRAACA